MRAVVRRARGWLAFPPQEGESEAARLVRLLDLCLVVSAGVTGIFLLLTWTGMGGLARLLTGLALAAFPVLGRLSRLGFPRFAAAAYLAVGCWLSPPRSSSGSAGPRR
jgi:hypothetical protein